MWNNTNDDRVKNKFLNKNNSRAGIIFILDLKNFCYNNDMDEFIKSLLPSIQNLGFLGYWIILFAAFAESLIIIGSFIPGTVIVLFAGFLASQDVFDIGKLFWFAAIGVILGDSLNFYLGTKGKKLFKNSNKILNSAYLEVGERFFAKHGGKSVFLSKFIAPPLRAVVAFVAGLAKMRKRFFFLWAGMGGLLWSAAYLFLGYFFGGALGAIEAWSARISFFVFSFIFLLAVIWLAIKKGKPFYALLKTATASIKKSFASSPKVKMTIRRYPSVFIFLRNRFRKDSLFGLPLTLFFIAFVYIFLLLMGIAQNTVASHFASSFDIRTENYLASFRNPALIKLFYLITLLGNWQIIASFAAAITFLFFIWKKRSYIIPFFVLLSGTTFFVYAGKLIVHRPRPEGVYIEHLFSFPSGHAAISAAFYGFLAYVVWRELPKWKYRLNIMFFWIALALAIGLSRLYLGVHFLSDIVGGYLVGLLWLAISISILQWRFSKIKRPAKQQKMSFASKTLTTAVIALQLIFFLSFGVDYAPNFTVLGQTVPILTADPTLPFSQNNLNRFTENLIGAKQEPVMFIIASKNEKDIKKVFEEGGWYEADQANIGTLSKAFKNAILNEPYSEAPIPPAFWQGTVNGYAFEKPTEANTAKERYYGRLWKTHIETPDYKFVYVGTAVLDVAQIWGLARKIDSDLDYVREILFKDLKGTGEIQAYSKINFTEPIAREGMDKFFTDGTAYIIYLK